MSVQIVFVKFYVFFRRSNVKNIVMLLLFVCSIAWGQLNDYIGSIDVTKEGINPECVLIDSTNFKIYISIHNTQNTGAKDGLIGVYDLQTHNLEKIFQCGSNVLIDPMGMALIGNFLYVANSDLTGITGGNIVRINVVTGDWVSGGNGVALPAGGNNYFDLTTDGTNLWAGSSLSTPTGNLYRFSQLENWPNPTVNTTSLVTNARGNGVILGAGNDIWVADFSGGNHAGHVQSYDRNTGTVGTLWNFFSVGANLMDGLAWIGEPGNSDLYTTDWGANVYLRSHKNNSYTTIISGFEHAADIDIDKNNKRLYVVDMTADEIKIYGEKKSEKHHSNGHTCGAIGIEFLFLMLILKLLSKFKNRNKT